MFWGPFSGAGWIAGVVTGLLWIAIIVGAIVLLRRELPHLQFGPRSSPALRLLEERYARGEISREEFLERRTVLRQQQIGPPPATTPPVTPPPEGPPEGPPQAEAPVSQPADPTEPLPPIPPSE